MNLINLLEYDNVVIKIPQLDFELEKKICSMTIPTSHKLIDELNRNVEYNPYFTMVETECPRTRNLISSNGKIYQIDVDTDQIRYIGENPNLNGETAVVAVQTDCLENSRQSPKYISLQFEFPTTLYRILADNKLLLGNISITLEQLINNMKQLNNTCVYPLSVFEYLVYQFKDHKWIPHKFTPDQLETMVDRIDPMILANI